MSPALLAVVAVGGLALLLGPPHRPPTGTTGARRAERATRQPVTLLGRSPRRSAERDGTDGTLPLRIARLVERLATVISAGLAPRPAWTALAGTLEDPELARLARAVGAGADPRRAATGPLTRSPQMQALGAALDLCERTGAPTGPLLASLAHALRDVADAELARRSAFAGPRATGRLLLFLPVAGMGLGILLGADPVGMLLTSNGGRILLVLGVLLAGLGWWWMRRLTLHAAGPAADGTAIDPSIVMELVSGPLSAGAPLARALGAVADCLDGAAPATVLSQAARGLEAGIPAATALADLPTDLAPVREAALLSERIGADLTGLLRSAARDTRRGRAREAEAAAARLGVRLVLPTGLALLPSFVLLGIVPTVIALLDGPLAQVGL